MSINGRHVLLVEDIIDTGLTLNYLAKTLLLREPASLAAVTLLDRPYRRLVDDLPVRYVGFTVPDEFFVGYGFDMDERYRNLPGPEDPQRSLGHRPKRPAVPRGTAGAVGRRHAASEARSSLRR